jgi:hypothetical protein
MSRRILVPLWQRPVMWALIVLAFPFVCLWRCYVAAKWRVWAGRVIATGEVRRG